jgi:hypothetical protein
VPRRVRFSLALTLAPLNLSLCLGLTALAGDVACSVPRQVHEPRPYPELRLSSRRLELQVRDQRPRADLPSVRQLFLPRSFEPAAKQRLSRLVGERGPALRVTADVVRADEVGLVDARGEMTRVLVKLSFEIAVVDGPLLRRAESQSSSDLPRDEATPEEVDFVLEATALDAFDRYFAERSTLESLQHDLDAYLLKHPEHPS